MPNRVPVLEKYASLNKERRWHTTRPPLGAPRHGCGAHAMRPDEIVAELQNVRSMANIACTMGCLAAGGVFALAIILAIIY